MKSISPIHKESGAVSLFSVVFAMLLMSVVTISFVRLMTSDQNRATNNDLSQSAYDSALAGVEDAKRALVWYQEQCKASPASCSPGGTWNGVLSSDTCNYALLRTGVIPGGTGLESEGANEIPVQSSVTGENELNQAYTCVTMKLNTDNFVGELTPNESALVPLVSDGDFKAVKIEWFSKDDVSSPDGTVQTPAGTSKLLLTQADWILDRPSLMRTQFMQIGNNFTLGDFDFTTDSGESNANTLFLYPLRTGLRSTELGVKDSRRDSSGNSTAESSDNAPFPTRCETNVSAGNYACSMTLDLPSAIGGGRDAAYLRLTAFYAATHFRVTLLTAPTGGTEVPFRGVQPLVDSTGRANDVFRRVQSRVDLYDTSFPYPEGAIDVNGGFCKNFGVSDSTYSNNDATCRP